MTKTSEIENVKMQVKSLEGEFSLLSKSLASLDKTVAVQAVELNTLKSITNDTMILVRGLHTKFDTLSERFATKEDLNSTELRLNNRIEEKTRPFSKVGWFIGSAVGSAVIAALLATILR